MPFSVTYSGLPYESASRRTRRRPSGSISQPKSVHVVGHGGPAGLPVPRNVVCGVKSKSGILGVIGAAIPVARAGE